MKKQFLALFTAIVLTTNLFGQNELDLYKRIYKTADSLKAIGQITTVDTISIFKKAKELDEKHPSGFFEVSGDYMSKSQFNEAAFIYYLGLMRFRYYNSANPDYKASNDGALLGAMRSVVGEPVNTYLKTDIGNFISIMKLTISYYSNNDFKFFSKDKNMEKFNAQIKSYESLIIEVESNKEKYREQWDKERKEMEAKF